MAISHFPDVESADPSGVLAIGGDLAVESLLLAYRSGIFPWPHEGYPLLWFAPPLRAIIEFSDLHIPKRVEKYLKKAGFEFRVNTAFAKVIAACSQTPRRGQPGTWITDEMMAAYTKLHNAGYAYSFETFQEDQLVGGLYGVKIGAMFCGESMFHRVDHASKFALINTIEHLKSDGSSWMDVQMLSPLLRSFGAKELPRAEFMEKLARTLPGEH